MVGLVATFILFCLFLLCSYPSSSLPLCTDLRPPSISERPLSFCSYNGSICCDTAQDQKLQKQLQAMDISNPTCSSIMKSILCSRCDQFSAELYKADLARSQIPLLCNTTRRLDLSPSKQEARSFCSSVWDACQDVSILESPFAPSLQAKAGGPLSNTSSKLAQVWQSKTEFCNLFGVPSDDEAICFDGEPVSLHEDENPVLPKGLCLEKIGNGSYLNMVAHPDGSNRAFFSNQRGEVWLAVIPEQGSGKTLGLDEFSPFVDLSDLVHFDATFGMMGMAFHPNFSQNGRFFASYNCDQLSSPGCSGRCSCNSDVDCDPAKLNSSSGSSRCQYHSVIAEFSANGTGESEPSLATSAKPSEVRRIFTIGLTSTSGHGGQILFGPSDGYLYFMTGDGGIKDFSQNKKSLMGKILRLDVDDMPSAKEIKEKGLWGNYSIPRDNPYAEDKDLQPEIWATGLRNPWRCSFDSERPAYFMCADVGQDHYEEVDIITKGGNYGWNIYEGTAPVKQQSHLSTAENSSANSTNFIFPVLGYTHKEVNKKIGSASITGGYFYRSKTDPCVYGSYLYADLYASNIWAAGESPKSSGNFTSTLVPFRCASDSPIQCGSIPGTSLPALQYIYSFGEDNLRDVFILASTGVYRIVSPGRCNYTCSKGNGPIGAASPPDSPSSSASRGHLLTGMRMELLPLYLSSLLLTLCFA